jgi:SNF2 family DNA or RNA helicase
MEDDGPMEIDNATVEDVGDLRLSAPTDPVEHIVPAAVNNRLRQYQRDGAKFLYSLFKEGKGGILGDGTNRTPIFFL